jgi:hypothetical protein
LKLLPDSAKLLGKAEPALVAVIDRAIESASREVPFNIGITELVQPPQRPISVAYGVDRLEGSAG